MVDRVARCLGGVVLVAALLGACAPAEAPRDRSAGGSASQSSGAAPSAAQAGGTLTLVFPSPDAGDVRSLDPQVDGSTYANTITPALYDSLIIQDPRDSSLQP